jgi:CRISPR-associated protein Csh1
LAVGIPTDADWWNWSASPIRRSPLIKEMVDFSRQLEMSGIYDRISDNLKKIDRPIMVIPVNDDLTGILVDEIYFVFKRVEGNTFYLEENGKEKAIKIDAPEGPSIPAKSLDQEDQKWQVILRSLRLYSNKLSTDDKGGKSIGSNKGTNSYHLLIFNGKFESGEFDVKRMRYKGDLFYSRQGLGYKISNTYETKTIEKGIPKSIEENEKKIFLALLDKFKDPGNLDKIWGEIHRFLEACAVYDEKKKKNVFPFDVIFVVLKLPKRFYEDEKKNLYKDWYDKYLQKKIFKVDNPDVYYTTQCRSCGSEDVDTYLPDCFNNLDAGKPFLQHLDRKRPINTAVCGACALEIYKFQEYFLNRLKMSLFPLFIHHNQQEKTIHLFNQQEKIEKLSFQDIISEIYRETSEEELDFYLVFYSRQDRILFFDYITGFHYKIKSTDIFRIESILDDYFFNKNLCKNYFTSEVKTENRQRDHLIYTYRQVIFDFVYRAKYSSLDRWILMDLYGEILKMQLKQLVSKDKFIKEKKVKESFQHYLELDKLFTGVFMDTIKKIQENQTIRDKESFAYYSGQIAYYLLSQSKSENRTHSLMEPFINAGSFSALAIRIEELFNSYKHALSFNSRKFNTVFSAMWAFLYDHIAEPFTRELKILFYAGYFNNEENIFYQPGKKEEQPK